MAAEGPGGLVRVLAKPVGAHALVEAAPTYINLAHLLDAPVTTNQAGEVVVTLHLPGRASASRATPPRRSTATSAARRSRSRPRGRSCRSRGPTTSRTDGSPPGWARGGG